MLSTRPLLFVLSLFSLGLAACADDGSGSEAGEIPEVDCTMIANGRSSLRLTAAR